MEEMEKIKLEFNEDLMNEVRRISDALPDCIFNFDEVCVNYENTPSEVWVPNDLKKLFKIQTQK